MRITGLFPLCVLCASVVNPPAFALDPRPLTDEVLYQIMPIAWRDSDNDSQRFGDFDGMTASLDYLQSLGITGVWMTPIFPTAAYHGYQHGPGDLLNSRFGTEPQFLNFVQQAHARGIKVFIDFVVYGISHNSIWYQSTYGNPASPYDAWLAFTNTLNTTYQGSVYNTWDGASVGFIHWDLRNTNANQLVTQWARKWLDPNNDGDPSDGIDGFRLDHVWEYYGSGPGGWGYNLIDFWMPWHAALKATNPNVFTFAEQADWGITGVSLMPAFGSTFSKPWEFAVRDALSSESTAGLYSQTAATLAAQPPGRHFLGTINDHDVDRVTSILGGSLTKAKVAAVIHLTSPMVPIIYYGDEIGMLGVKGNFGSDANDIPMREPFKWNAVAGPPMSNYWTLNAAAYNARYSQNNDGRSVQEQQGVSGSLLELYKQLIALRKTSPALKYGSYVPITNNNTRTYSFLRHAPGEQTLLVAVRIRNSSASTTFNLSNTTIPGGTTTVQDLLTGQFLTNLTDANKSAYPITMGAYSYRILAVNLTPNSPAPQPIDGIDIPQAFGSFSLVGTQNNTTLLGDNISELNQLFVRPTATGLRVGITGNLSADGTGLAILIDSTSGGQNTLNLSAHTPPPGGPNNMSGTQLDSGFEPDQMYWINTAGGNVYVDQFTLPAAGSTVKTFRGQGIMNDGDGLLTNGVNPNAMHCAVSNTNTAGITDSSIGAASTARDGFDLLIPYADIGSAGLGGTIRIAALIVQSSGRISNQWLPGLGGGQGMLNFSPNLNTVPGAQFAVVPLIIAGDIDADGDVDAIDESIFVDVLLGTDADPDHQARSDINRDGEANALDVQLFTATRLAM